MKDKTLAGLLALFLGVFGVHRFYLGQPKLGVLYLILMFTGISALLGLIDAIVLLTMDVEDFNEKYNTRKAHYEARPRRKTAPKNRRPHQRHEYVDNRRTGPVPRQAAPGASRRSSPYKLSGIEKYKDYDFDGAIEDFKKALAVNSADVAVHFNLACAYSITERADKSLYHLNEAVKNGFVDFDKIKNHDALAYLRIQDEFETFVANGYRLDAVEKMASPTVPPAAEVIPDTEISTDLLEQIKKLGELREKGFLTEEEFASQKKRLLG